MQQPKVIEFSYGPFIHPAVIRNLPQTVTVENENHIHLFNEKYYPLNNETLEIGRELFIQNGQYNMQASYVNEIKAYNEAKAEKMERDAEIKRIAKEKKRKNFWNQYNIPFEFTVEIKERLNGLSFNSMGNGTAKNSVFHIFVKEDIKIKHLKRKAGSFLCSPQKAKWGGNWSGQLGENDYKKHIITCKACLQKLEKFKNND